MSHHYKFSLGYFLFVFAFMLLLQTLLTPEVPQISLPCSNGTSRRTRSSRW
jgi:hypothetical protein